MFSPLTLPSSVLSPTRLYLFIPRFFLLLFSHFRLISYFSYSFQVICFGVRREIQRAKKTEMSFLGFVLFLPLSFTSPFKVILVIRFSFFLFSSLFLCSFNIRRIYYLQPNHTGSRQRRGWRCSWSIASWNSESSRLPVVNNCRIVGLILASMLSCDFCLPETYASLSIVARALRVPYYELLPWAFVWFLCWTGTYISLRLQSETRVGALISSISLLRLCLCLLIGWFGFPASCFFLLTVVGGVPCCICVCRRVRADFFSLTRTLSLSFCLVTLYFLRGLCIHR